MLVYLVAFIVITGSLAILSKTVDLIRSLSSRQLRCPRCHNAFSLKRTPRNRFDRVLNRLVESRRYMCLICRWNGLLREIPAPSPAAPSPFSNPELPVLQDMQKA